METNYLKTFYRVTRYIHSRWKDKYPTFKIRKENENYFQTLEEAQASVLATSKDYKLYAMVITELPYGYPCTEEEYLSRWVYRADGSLNGCVSYAELDQRDEFPGLNELGTGDELGRMRIYRGRKPEEVHFQRGDLIEVLCYPANRFWGNGYVELAIVVDLPPTVDEISKQLEEYKGTHTGYNLTFHHLGYEFEGAFLDNYKVIAASNPGVVDHVPTIAAFPLSRSVSSRRKKMMVEQYKKYLNKELK